MPKSLMTGVLIRRENLDTNNGQKEDNVKHKKKMATVSQSERTQKESTSHLDIELLVFRTVNK